ncbi:bacillithiol biosynthesis cysteine-adding enzyme BshC [Siminovitchia sediminis]|uniref:Putative cysteine ligase BshC n=1 Tax=Siminovitchia sediminis TaxID=1274353 RepID=A0ABW4KEK0_9BACI
MELAHAEFLATNRFASLYMENEESVKDFFHYDIQDETVFTRRYEDLMKREFDRKGIADCIQQYMKKYPASQAVEESLGKLRQPDSTVVIGGQQAGLLTGPLYTIYKVISIIVLAKQQEAHLGKPVVPVFWVAGEDHDYLEINHVYAFYHGQCKKKSYRETVSGKKMASHIEFNTQKMKAWIREVFSHFGDRSHTKEVLSFLDEAVINTRSFTEFFSYILMHFFKEYGLLLIDSADPQLRVLEKPFFSRILDQRQEITDAILLQQEKKHSSGFASTIEIDRHGSNVFYYHHQERELLEFDPAENTFVNKTGELCFTPGELLDLLESHPERFSNNVATRPLMQEWLFPTLAFIAGPGEISYWGELLSAFEVVDSQMPPIIPRLNMTLLDKRTESDMEELQLSIEDVMRNGTAEEKARFLASVQDNEFEAMIAEAKMELEKRYEVITEKVGEMDRGHVALAQTNLQMHVRQLEFLQRKVEDSIKRKHEAILEKYDRIEHVILPEGQPQERIWNIFYFINEYSMKFIDDLLTLPYKFDGRHQIIKL